MHIQGRKNYQKHPVCYRLTPSLTPPRDVQLFRPHLRCLVRFERSIRFCHLEFDKKGISDDFMAHVRVFRGGELILSDFKYVSFCGPRGHCFCRKIRFCTCIQDCQASFRGCLKIKFLFNPSNTDYILSTEQTFTIQSQNEQYWALIACNFIYAINSPDVNWQ